MSSQVGFQHTEIEILQQAVALEMDCVAALGVAAERAPSDFARTTFVQMAAECAEHARVWQMRLQLLGGAAGAPNRITAWLNRCKVQVVAPFGQRAIAFAVANNSADTVEAYRRVASRGDLPAYTRSVADRMAGDAASQQTTIDAMRHGTQP